MLYFLVRYNAVKQKCSNCGNRISDTPAIGDKSPGQFWVATRISFAKGYMDVESVVACQRCRQLDTWDHFEDPKNRSKIPDDPDGARLTAILEKKHGKGLRGQALTGGADGSGQLRPRAERVRPPAVGGTGGLRAGM